MTFIFYRAGDHRDLHSFPTRRSSDLHRVRISPQGLSDGARRLRRPDPPRSEEHTSELQSQFHLVCRLLPEKINKDTKDEPPTPIGGADDPPDERGQDG